MIRFARLRTGDWGVRSTTALEAGQRIVARTAAGRDVPLTVVRVVWTDNVAWLAEVSRVSEETPASGTVETVERRDTIPSPPMVASFAENERETTPCGRRPYPRVTECSAEDLASWDPEKREVYYQVGDAMVRAGEQFAIVRSGHAFPLGHSSDHRRVVSHNATRSAILAGPVASGQITPGKCHVVAHGYHTVQSFAIRHMSTSRVAGVDVTHELVVVNDHTGSRAMRAAIVCYVGLDAIGASAHTRARHIASNPEIWQGEVDAMIEKAILAQDDLVTLLLRAQAHIMTDEDRKWLRKRGVIVKRSSRTALDAFRAWHGAAGKRARPTWGVWSRRLDDNGLTHLAAFLDRPAGDKAIPQAA